MKKSIRKITLIALILGVILHVSAQERLDFDLQNNKYQEQKVRIKTSVRNSRMPEFDLFIAVSKDPENKSITLSIRRGAESPDLLLCYSLREKVDLIKNMKECESRAAKLCNKKNEKTLYQTQQLDYFLESSALRLPYEECYRQLARGNYYEFMLPVTGSENLVDLTLTFYVAKNKNKGKRPTQLLYRADPINVKIDITQNPCNKAQEMISEMNKQITQLEVLYAEAQEAVKSTDRLQCDEQLNDIHQEILADFPFEQPQWEEYLDCQDIIDGSMKYDKLRRAILKEQCVAPYPPEPPPPPPSILPPSPPTPLPPPTNTIAPKTKPCELGTMNQLLMYLQMDINKKKMAGESIDEERKEFAKIKDLANKNLNVATCDEELVKAYKNYCTKIEKILNN